MKVWDDVQQHVGYGSVSPRGPWGPQTVHGSVLFQATEILIDYTQSLEVETCPKSWFLHCFCTPTLSHPA